MTSNEGVPPPQPPEAESSTQEKPKETYSRGAAVFGRSSPTLSELAKVVRRFRIQDAPAVDTPPSSTEEESSNKPSNTETPSRDAMDAGATFGPRIGLPEVLERGKDKELPETVPPNTTSEQTTPSVSPESGQKPRRRPIGAAVFGETPPSKAINDLLRRLAKMQNEPTEATSDDPKK